MMTTYELIRRLVQIDSTGTMPVMLSVKTMLDNRVVEGTGFIDELWVEHSDDADVPFIVLCGVDG